MKNIILICVAFVSFGHIAKSQQLTINETVMYINNAIRENEKFTLSADGYILYTIGVNSRYPMNYRVHISELKGPTIWDDSSLSWIVRLECPAPRGIYSKCIQYKCDNENRSESVIRIRTRVGDKYSAEKLKNAFNYLFALARETGMFDRNDNDPFAPKNFNPFAIEIKSTSNNGSVKLSKQGGVYLIPITIGGITKNFVFDTGASDVLISEELEYALIQNGTLKKEDYLTPALYRIADGSIVQCRRLIIPQLIIGNFTITNVQASVGVGSVPLLLGKSVLEKFKNWSIDNLSEKLYLEK